MVEFALPGRGFALRGATFRFLTEAGHVYVTVNADGDSRPVEVFVRTGKSGSTVNSLAEALGRLASLALRSGADSGEVARELRGIKSVQTRQEPGAPVAAVDSIPDAVGRAIELFLGDSRREAGASEEGVALFLPLGAASGRGVESHPRKAAPAPLFIELN
jgi:ribonucleoside-diphosphate reductase alpha chain